MTQRPDVDLLLLREALEASWDEQTSYRGVLRKGTPSLGQCYPTSWLIWQFFPEMQIIKGKVWNGAEMEVHFWNGLWVDGVLQHIDLTWQQFPHGSSVVGFRILDRNNLGDGEDTVRRCQLLRQRVTDYINAKFAH